MQINKIVVHNEAKIIFCNKELSGKNINIMIKQILQCIDLNNTNSIAIVLSRNEFLIPSILACLKIGLPYIPIDPDCPTERMKFILSNSEASLIITEQRFKNQFNDCNLLIVDDINDSILLKNVVNENLNDSEIAYIIYTSGSTGRPKGVEIYRKSLINLINGVQEVMKFEITDRIGCLTTPSFDIFFSESIMALSLGMTVVLADDNTAKNPKLIAKWLIAKNINIIQMTPSRIQQLIYIDKSLSCLQNISKILVTGEKLPLHTLEYLQRYTNSKIYNLYGPTETTIWSSIADLTKSKTVHIGHPIKNNKLYIFSEDMKEVPIGENGEIYISGHSLAKGYYNDVEKTKKSFVYLPKTGERLYKTGDIGRKNLDGNIECFGRIDNQIKLRGYRIELEEIECVINEYKDIENSLVILDKDDFLTVLYTADSIIDQKEVTNYLVDKLPKYMIPRKYIQISNFIYTFNNKIDRHATINMYHNNINY